MQYATEVGLSFQKLMSVPSPILLGTETLQWSPAPPEKGATNSTVITFPPGTITPILHFFLLQ
jgi:hypothetical protein